MSQTGEKRDAVCVPRRPENSAAGANYGTEGEQRARSGGWDAGLPGRRPRRARSRQLRSPLPGVQTTELNSHLRVS